MITTPVSRLFCFHVGHDTFAIVWLTLLINLNIAYLPRFLVQSLLSAMLTKLLKFKSLRSILACCNRIIARTTYSTCKSCFLYCHKTTPKLHLSQQKNVILAIPINKVKKNLIYPSKNSICYIKHGNMQKKTNFLHIRKIYFSFLCFTYCRLHQYSDIPLGSNHIDQLLQLKDLASPVYFLYFTKAKRFRTAFSSRSLLQPHS